MGGHDQHGHNEYAKVPDYRIYKVEDAPQLMTTKRALAAQGLCDPWLRNEVWRYNVESFGTIKQRTSTLFLRGFRYGFAAFVLTVIGKGVYDRINPTSHHEHDEHHNH